MKIFSISGRCIASPPPEDWREQLSGMLGAKPRRIGVWAELGLYGALSCMSDAGESTLPQDAMLILASQRGTYVATDIALEQLCEDLPMPLTFLQTQPSQLLALLAAQMKWKGNACFFAGTELLALLNLIAAQTGKDGVLLGWVDEMEEGTSNWLRLRPVETECSDFTLAGIDGVMSNDISYILVSKTDIKVRNVR